MAIVDYLGSQSGVQYNGIQVDDDTSGVDLQNVLLIGEFKRGPFNRPFKVTKETMEVKLSYDYNNPYYTFLEDAFEHGAEYIWVMRVSREQVVEPEPIWGDWILNSGVTVNTNGIAHYTAYKTNQREYYDSYANLDLTAAVVRSLHDADMQQWQAVKDAANELTGVAAWEFDTANKQVIYVETPILCTPSAKFCYEMAGGKKAGTPQEVCRLFNKSNGTKYHSASQSTCYYNVNGKPASLAPIQKVANVNYDPDAIEQKSIPYQQVAQKIISNASSSNQAISLLAEAYLENVATSIFNTDPSKQFVKLSDLLSQFELNKTLRT